MLIITLLAQAWLIVACADLLRHVVPLDDSTCSRSSIMAVRARRVRARRLRGTAARPLPGVVLARPAV